MGFLKKIVRAFGGLRLNEGQSLSGFQLDHLCVSAMYAAQQSAYLNSYETGLSKSEVSKLLQDHWGIYSSEHAQEVMHSLIERNNDIYLSVLYRAYESKESYVEILRSGLPDDETTFQEYIKSYRALNTSIPEMIRQGLFESYAVLERTKDTGWNYGRGSFIARCCFEMGYISKSELQQYLEESYKGLKNYCKTWEEYTSSYVYGRALWGGSHNEGMVSIAKDLLNNKKSPLKEKTYL